MTNEEIYEEAAMIAAIAASAVTVEDAWYSEIAEEIGAHHEALNIAIDTHQSRKATGDYHVDDGAVAELLWLDSAPSVSITVTRSPALEDRIAELERALEDAARLVIASADIITAESGDDDGEADDAREQAREWLALVGVEVSSDDDDTITASPVDEETLPPAEDGAPERESLFDDLDEDADDDDEDDDDFADDDDNDCDDEGF